MSDQRDTRPEEPSAYVFSWGVYSWICVALGAVFVLMWSLQSGSTIPGIIIGVLIAVIGGILFALVPRKSLGQQTRPMTPKARAAARRRREQDGGRGGSSATGSGEA